MFELKTQRLTITELTPDMIQAVHENSMDEDNRRFVPDEVFQTLDEAAETVVFLMSCYGGQQGPFVYALLRDGENIGHVQLVQIEEGWEIGYHVAKKDTGNGYATEAVKAFLPAISEKLHLSKVYGICLAENRASCRVLEKCGFSLLFAGQGLYQGVKREICKYIYSVQTGA